MDVKGIIGDSISLCKVLDYEILDTINGFDLQAYITDFTLRESEDMLDIRQYSTLMRYLRERRLIKQEFDEIEMESIFHILCKYKKKIALGDASTLFLAKQLNAYLISYESVLENICDDEGIAFKNFNWLFTIS